MDENYIFNSRNLGLGGAIILFIGCFLPLVSLPIFGSITFVGNGEIQGILVIIFAALSLAFVLFNAYAGLFITSIPVLSMLIAILINLNRVFSNAGNDLSSPLAKDIANAAAKAVQIQWGWAVMFIGACLLFTAALIYCLNEFKLYSSNSNEKQTLFYKYGSMLIVSILLTGAIFYAKSEKLF